MLRYAIERLIWLVPTLLAMALVTFLVMHATPGSPLDPQAPNANPLPPELQKNLAEKYGLDKPLYIQFATFIKNAVQLDFGFSYQYKSRTVAEIIGNTFPVSLQLGTLAFLFAVVVGVTLGALAAMHQNSWIDYLCVMIATLGVSLPNFVIGILFILLFCITLQWFPVVGWDTPRHWVLPTLTLALGPLAIIARYTRSSMLDVIRSDYVRTAQAKGLGGQVIVTRHILKNALIPVVTILGPIFAAIGTGSFFVEALFSVPGMGKFFVSSMSSRDYNMIMAVILLYGVFLGIMNLFVDLVYGWLDPRIRFD
ncbi:MAG: ABC transporter permease [Caldilineaceae bacterium]|nr:ABC transporter permease [Caldilineaceae bacterium]